MGISVYFICQKFCFCNEFDDLLLRAWQHMNYWCHWMYQLFKASTGMLFFYFSVWQWLVHKGSGVCVCICLLSTSHNKPELHGSQINRSMLFSPNALWPIYVALCFKLEFKVTLPCNHCNEPYKDAALIFFCSLDDIINNQKRFMATSSLTPNHYGTSFMPIAFKAVGIDITFILVYAYLFPPIENIGNFSSSENSTTL